MQLIAIPFLTLVFVRLERYLKNSIPQSVAIQRLNSYDCFVVVGHGNEAESFAFVSLEVSDYFDVLDGAEGTEQLPQDILFRLRRKIVYKYTPPGAIQRTAG